MTIDSGVIIIGAGAAGLAAACTAADHGIPALLVERRHRPGLKLLMCGNNRCNISRACSAQEMLRDYGTPVGDFLANAVNAMPPEMLRRWFAHLGLETRIAGKRIYPASEKADDVLHAFTDFLRDNSLPILFNCRVTAIKSTGTPQSPQFTLETENGMVLRAKALVLATGGCSYPKTGSTGDGYEFAKMLDLKSRPPQPGLSGLDIPQDSPLAHTGLAPLEVAEVVASAPGLASTQGNLIFDNGVLRGKAIYDLSRLAARKGVALTEVTLDLLPNGTGKALHHLAPSPASRSSAFNAAGIPPMLAQALSQLPQCQQLEDLHHLQITGVATRPLKEAIVTSGGIALEEVEPATMEAKRYPGLHIVGEALDVDGPTGGYNLHAAFSTAILAIRHIAATMPSEKNAEKATEAHLDSTPAPRKDFGKRDRRFNGKGGGEKGEYRSKNGAERRPQKSKGNQGQWGADIWQGKRLRRES